jgi:hypothetical protein
VDDNHLVEGDIKYDSILAESKDAGTGSSLAMREFIVFNRAYTYPEYLVYYKRVPN